jgi:PhnB protein
MNMPEQYNLQTVFNAAEQYRYETPEGTILHGEARIGDAVVMFAEASEQFTVKTAGLFIYVSDADGTYTKALAAGAVTVAGQEPSDKDYGAPSRACGVTDPFGNDWWITSVKQEA